MERVVDPSGRLAAWARILAWTIRVQSCFRSGRPAASWVQPAFNVTVRIANPSNGAVNTLTLHDVKIDNWVYTLPEDEFVMEQAGFQALYMTVEEG